MELIVATDNQTDGDSDRRSLRVLRAFRLFRLTKMLRLFRMKRILGRFQAFYKQKSKILSTLHMMKIIVFLLYSGHIMACIFYAVGSPSMDEDSEDDEVGWVQRYHFASNTTGIDLSAEPAWFSLYITSFFLSITNEAVTVASTNAEKAYVSAQFLLYTLLVAYLTGTFASVIMQHNVSKQKFVTKINELREFMEKRRIPEEMRARINTFYDEVYEREGFYNEDELLADLPPQVSTALSDVTTVALRCSHEALIAGPPPADPARDDQDNVPQAHQGHAVFPAARRLRHPEALPSAQATAGRRGRRDPGGGHARPRDVLHRRGHLRGLEDR